MPNYQNKSFKYEHFYYVCVFLGNSFMLHQIRKMVGLIIAICREQVDEDIFQEVYGEQKVGIPTAPSLGLRLEEQHFTNYNRNVSQNFHVSIFFCRFFIYVIEYYLNYERKQLKSLLLF